MLGTGGVLRLRWELAWGEAPVVVADAGAQPSGVAARQDLGPRPGAWVIGVWATAAVAAAIAGGWP